MEGGNKSDWNDINTICKEICEEIPERLGRPIIKKQLSFGSESQNLNQRIQKVSTKFFLKVVTKNVLI